MSLVADNDIPHIRVSKRSAAIQPGSPPELDYHKPRFAAQRRGRHVGPRLSPFPRPSPTPKEKPQQNRRTLPGLLTPSWDCTRPRRPGANRLNGMRNRTELPFAEAEGNYAERLSTIANLCCHVNANALEANLLRWLFDRRADSEGVSLDREYISQVPWIGSTPSTLRRAEMKWAAIGVLTITTSKRSAAQHVPYQLADGP